MPFQPILVVNGKELKLGQAATFEAAQQALETAIENGRLGEGYVVDEAGKRHLVISYPVD